jgi:hypothetical protein
MYIVKLLSLFFLGAYLVLVGLQGLGFVTGVVHPGVVGFLALVAGVLFIIKGVKCCTGECKSCERPPRE